MPGEAEEHDAHGDAHAPARGAPLPLRRLPAEVPTEVAEVQGVEVRAQLRRARVGRLVDLAACARRRRYEEQQAELHAEERREEQVAARTWSG